MFYRAVQQNTLLLNEERESLRQKLSRAEERSVALSTLEVECEVSCVSECTSLTWKSFAFHRLNFEFVEPGVPVQCGDKIP